MSQSAQEVIDHFRARKRAEDHKREREMREREMHMQALETERAELLEKKMRPATTDEYNRWMKGFIEQGGTPTHSYDYPMSRWDMFVALRDFEVLPLYGALAINIIVPKGIQVSGTDRGHCNLYFVENFEPVGGCAPIFSDTVIPAA